jgi:hypothetical protein
MSLMKVKDYRKSKLHYLIAYLPLCAKVLFK